MDFTPDAGTITMFSTTWCGYCNRLKKQLDAEGIGYTEINIELVEGTAELVEQINGGNRVPVLVFFSEDGFEVARYGERTLSRYRRLMQEQTGEGCKAALLHCLARLLTVMRVLCVFVIPPRSRHRSEVDAHGRRGRRGRRARLRGGGVGHTGQPEDGGDGA